MSARTVQERLAADFADGVTLVAEQGAQSRLRSRRDCVRATIRALVEDGYDMLVDLFAVDYVTRTERFEVVYHLAEQAGPGRVFVHVAVPEDDAVVPTVCDILLGANWPEREAFDLFGIRFDGHPNLKRLLMPDDWEGHPLRKDYPRRGTEPLAPIVVE